MNFMRQVYSVTTLFLITALCQAQGQITTPDSVYLTFGKIFRAELPPSLSFSNPHQVAQYAFFRGSKGQTKQLLREMGQVETDADLGKAFRTFLEEVGPDLIQFKGQTIYLQFYGYAMNKATTLWYYYLVSKDGTHLPHDPWITIHRSPATGQCALTGISLYDPKDGTPAMPKDLVTSNAKKN
jgi:hypothetical protein